MTVSNETRVRIRQAANQSTSVNQISKTVFGIEKPGPTRRQVIQSALPKWSWNQLVSGRRRTLPRSQWSLATV